MYDADDLLDEFSYEVLHQQLMGGSEIWKKVRLFFSSSNQFAFGLKMAHKIKALREHLDEIAANRRFHLEERPYVERHFISRQTHSSPPQVVIGREHDKEKIVELLLCSNCVENTSVVAIVGIGGLGKTTLAQMVYNDDRVKSHFELKMWVCVSDDLDVQLLVKNVIESASEQAPSSTQMDVLKKNLHKHINGRRYLLVLDDVWNEEVNKWSSFIDLLAVGARGSKILITTRSMTVAMTSHATSVHELLGLLENEAWSLFKQVAFNPSHQLSNPSRKVIGKEIVKKCCGVPLAIKAIGGVLYSKETDTEWEMFKDNELSKIDVFKHDILPILRLSYIHLPSPYKHCFAYCCLFPKDFQIPVDRLIQLWKAQGYIQSTNQSEILQSVGLKYFKDLFGLSFFQDVEMDSLGNIEYCKMHDLMHDLAVSVAGDNFSPSLDLQMTSFKNNPRHMSFWQYNIKHESSLLKMKKMRTFLKLDIYDVHVLKETEADALFRNLRRLRVLNLSQMGIRKLPNSIYKMKLLRYLDLSTNRDIKELPKSLISLHNLQVLNLEGCWKLKTLPSDMSKLVNLTDLNNGDCHKLSYTPSGIGKLTKLEKLSKFVIAKEQSISKHSARLHELHSLDNLRGELEITYLGYVENAASEVREGLLSSKHNLQKLKLYWGFYDHYNVGDQEMVMEALCPHPNLKELWVWGYKGWKPPSWLPSITNLVIVIIQNCSSIQRLPPFDQLLHLQNLFIYDMTELESIEVEYGGRSSSFFPSLTDLTLYECPKLKGFERLSSLSMEELPGFPCLSELSIRFCPNLIHLPLSPGVEMWDFNADVTLLSARLHLLDYRGLKPPSWLPSITYLAEVTIQNCSSIQRLPPLNQLLHLKTLEISKMSELESIEVEYAGGSSSFFLSLTHLTLEQCPKLKGFERLSSLSKEELPCFPCLSNLYVHDCPNLFFLPLFAELELLKVTGVKFLIKISMMPTNSAFTLSKLQNLTIANMEDCTENELNDGIQWQCLEALHTVCFDRMENMVSLPKGLQHATTLRSLIILACPRLECMPEWITNLIELQDLTIKHSPKVEQRCKNDSAEDWHKISHIPYIRIGYYQIQRNGLYLP